MKILLDCRSLVNAPLCGVVIYVQELLIALQRYDRKNEYLLWWNARREHALALPKISAPNFHLLRTRWPNKILNLSAWTGFPRLEKIIQSPIDLVFLPDPRPIALGRTTRLITTFHDTLPTTRPEMFSKKSRLFHKLIRHQVLANRSSKILAVSNFVRDGLIKHYQIPLEKITVAPLAAGDDLKPIKNLAELKRVQKKYNLPECFILTLSTLEPRKNLATLLRAFEKITDPNLRLVVAGSGNPKIFSAPSLFTRDPRVHFCGAIAKEDRSALYSLAKIFVMPSLEEGFGLPVLEAMACGVPVVASNISSLPEVVGTAGLLVNPNNADEIANALKKILANAQLQKTLQGKSLERAKKFSWEKTVCLTLKEINSYFL